MWFVEHTGLLNLGVSIIIWAIGFLIYRFGKPTTFKEVPFAKTAFECWLGQWGAYILIWFLLLGLPQKPQLTLAAVDIQTILALAFGYAMLRGRQAKWREFWMDAGVLYAVLLLFNGIVYFAISPPTQNLLKLWILPSEVAAAGALGFIALVFLARYGTPAISLAIALLIYLILQRPAYRFVFVDPVDADRGWIVALAFGKLLYAMLLYTVFFVPMRTTAAMSLFDWVRLKSIGRAIPTRLRPAGGGIVIGILLKFGTDLAAKWLEHLWHGSGSPPVS